MKKTIEKYIKSMVAGCGSKIRSVQSRGKMGRGQRYGRAELFWTSARQRESLDVTRKIIILAKDQKHFSTWPNERTTLKRRHPPWITTPTTPTRPPPDLFFRSRCKLYKWPSRHVRRETTPIFFAVKLNLYEKKNHKTI